MTPVIYNAVDQSVIDELKAADIYEIMLGQMARIPDGPKQIFVFIDRRPDRLTYYMYHRGFEAQADNGFSAITILNPAECPEVVKVVESEIRDIFDSPARVLWVENPLLKN